MEQCGLCWGKVRFYGPDEVKLSGEIGVNVKPRWSVAYLLSRQPGP